MSLEGSLVIASFELPDLDGAVFGGGGDLGVQGVECETGDAGIVPLEFQLGGGLGEVEFF